MVSSLWPSAGGPDVISATLLPESLTRLSPLMGEKKRENGVYLPTVYQMMFGCVSCSQFLLSQKKKNRLHTNFWSEKIRHKLICSSSWRWVSSWSPMISLTFLHLTCSKKYPYFLDKVPCQLMPSLYPDKARVIDCIWWWSSSTGFR